jgi:chloramphenicol 3-O phosphotransferase
MASARAFEEHAIHYWRPAANGGMWCDPEPAGMRLLSGGYSAAAALVRAGNNVVYDDVSLNEELLQECAKAFSPFDSFFVGVRCDLDVLAQRERERSDDRTQGAAIGMSARAHEHAVYDLEVDTTRTSSQDCARKIVERLNAGPGTALRKLAEA